MSRLQCGRKSDERESCSEASPSATCHRCTAHPSSRLVIDAAAGTISNIGRTAPCSAFPRPQSVAWNADAAY